MESENPVKDFFEALELAQPKTKYYFEVFYKRAFRLTNGKWYTRLFKKPRQPEPKVIQDAKKSLIMVYYWDHQKGIVAPPMRINYKRTDKGIINEYKLDLELWRNRHDYHSWLERVSNENPLPKDGEVHELPE